MNIHLEQYPGTPCGVPMERASRVTNDVLKVTCMKCLKHLDTREAEAMVEERDPEIPKLELNRMRYDRTWA